MKSLDTYTTPISTQAAVKPLSSIHIEINDLKDKCESLFRLVQCELKDKLAPVCKDGNPEEKDVEKHSTPSCPLAGELRNIRCNLTHLEDQLEGLIESIEL